METDNKCYVVIYDEIPYSNNMSFYRTINGVFRNCEEAIAYVKQRADRVIAELEESEIPSEVVYNAPSDNWPWLFTWEYDECQYTYKVVPYEYKDRKTEP